MLAKLLRSILLGLALLGCAWLAWCLAQGHPGWALTGVVLLLCVHAPVLAAEFLLMAWVNRRDPAPPATWRQCLRAWAGEVAAGLQVFAWRQPFFADEVPDEVPATAAGQRGVVLVHGFVCNRGLWTPWLRRLKQQGIPFVAVNLEPVFGSIDQYAACIDEAVKRLEHVTGQPPVLVCHSMGGLAARAWLSACQADARVHRVITIGSPHQGTWLGRFGYLTNARQMRQANGWLEALARQETPQRRARFTCFYGHCDNIVFPASTATLPQADNRHIPGTAHVEMVFRDEVFQEVLTWIGSSASTSSGGSSAQALPERTGTSAR